MRLPPTARRERTPHAASSRRLVLRAAGRCTAGGDLESDHIREPKRGDTAITADRDRRREGVDVERGRRIVHDRDLEWHRAMRRYVRRRPGVLATRIRELHGESIIRDRLELNRLR